MTKLDVIPACVIGLLLMSGSVLNCGGCSANPRSVYRQVKELEPAAKKRNEELRELSGMPGEEHE